MSEQKCLLVDGFIGPFELAAGSPWAKTRKKSPVKCGVTIEDSDISSWFTARMQG